MNLILERQNDEVLNLVANKAISSLSETKAQIEHRLDARDMCDEAPGTSREGCSSLGTTSILMIGEAHFDGICCRRRICSVRHYSGAYSDVRSPSARYEIRRRGNVAAGMQANSNNQNNTALHSRDAGSPSTGLGRPLTRHLQQQYTVPAEISYDR